MPFHSPLNIKRLSTEQFRALDYAVRGHNDLGCYGTGPGIKTPNIDRLAADGIRLSNYLRQACLFAQSWRTAYGSLSPTQRLGGRR